MMLEDTLLKLRFTRGDTDALRRIYEKYKDDLLRLAIALLNDVSLAEDVVNDSFVTFTRVYGKTPLERKSQEFPDNVHCESRSQRSSGKAAKKDSWVGSGRTSALRFERPRAIGHLQ